MTCREVLRTNFLSKNGMSLGRPETVEDVSGTETTIFPAATSLKPTTFQKLNPVIVTEERPTVFQNYLDLATEGSVIGT